MKSLNKIQLASIAAASVLVAYIGVASSLQVNQSPQELDFPAILTADAAAVDMFIKITDIKGESLDAKHLGEIEVLSYSWGVSNSGSSPRGGPSPVVFSEFSFTTATSKASPLLFLKSASGERIPTIVLTARHSGANQEDYLKVTLTDVLITSYQTSGGPVVGDFQGDGISLNFAKIEMEYKPQKADGTLDMPVKAGWDLKMNRKV
jgi:type VI secretion system secreted protein Hcp